MATDEDAIPGVIEEDPEVSHDPTRNRGRSTSATDGPATRRHASRAHLSAHDRITGQVSTEDLEIHIEVMNAGELRVTREVDVLGIEALALLSKKDPEEIEDLENTLRESRRPRSRQ